jgi:DNA repair protein RadD
MNRSPIGSPNGLLVARALEWSGVRAYEGGSESLWSDEGSGTQKGEEERIPPAAGFLDSLPASCEVLRDYQHRQVADLRDALHTGYRRIVVQAPTGSGKTHSIAAVTAAATDASLRVLVLATRSRLIRQLHERLEQFAVPHGVVAAPLPELRDNMATVQVASVDTLYRRALADKRMPLPPADVVIFDEAHLAGADSRLAILESFPNAFRIGFTATPARKSGRGLGAVFEAMILGPSVPELIAAGMLVRPRIFNLPVVTDSELSEIPKDAANDYQPKALGALLSRPKLVGDVVGNWLRIAAGKRSLCFAVNKAHGAQLVQEFLQAGVAAELLTDADSEETREQVVARLEGGATKIIVNCFLLAYGVDIPSLECIVLARPTRSLVMYLQMAGRGMRPAEDKADFLLIDHGRVVETLGLPHAPREWTLDEARNVNAEAREQTIRKSVEEKPRTCPECKHLWLVSEEGEACRECGWVPVPRPKDVVVEEAELRELESADKQLLMPHSPEVERFYREAVYWYAARWPNRWVARQKSGRWWAWCKTRERFRFPESYGMPRGFWDANPMPTTAATNGLLKAQLIRWAKRRVKTAA